jgi:hypothetical protein
MRHETAIEYRAQGESGLIVHSLLGRQSAKTKDNTCGKVASDRAKKQSALPRPQTCVARLALTRCARQRLEPSFSKISPLDAQYWREGMRRSSQVEAWLP